MKTKTTIKQTLLALTMALSIVSCKKDKKEDPTPPPVEVKVMTFTELKALSTGASVKVPDAKKITGIVISDVSAKNVDSKTVVLQDAATQAGMIITFDAAQTFAVNDQVEVVVSNQTLAQVNGEVVLQNVPAANAKKTGTGTITAKATTATDITTNKTAWDGTLVTLSEGSFSGGNGDGKYTGSLIYTDAAGAIKSNVLAGAAFAGTAYPAAVNTVTGIVRVNGTDVSVDIRNATDVAASTTITRTVTEDLSMLEYDDNTAGFATKNIGTVYLSGQFSIRAPLQGDGTFLPSPKYLYFISPSPAATLSLGSDGVLKGLKQVNITLASSKFTGKIDGADILNVEAFDPATATNSISIFFYDANFAEYKVATFSYKDVGVSHTFTYKLPGTEAELEAAIISQGESADRAKTAAASIFSRQNDNIDLTIKNSSSERPSNFNAPNAPLVIQKMVFGFGK